MGRWLALNGFAALMALAVSAPSLRAQPDPLTLVPEVLPAQGQTLTRPPVVGRPIDPPTIVIPPTPAETILPVTPLDPPLGFSGPSGVAPRSGRNAEYETVEDRWRIGFPFWDRYGQGFPHGLDYPYKLGRAIDPYNQNVLKGDYPIIGQHTFMVVTASTTGLLEGRTIPTATSPFESTRNEGEVDFFGRSGQLVYNQLATFSVDVFHGDAAFKPADWRVKLTPAFNYNLLMAQEYGVVSPDVNKGRERERGWATLQEWFGEVKLADLSPEYDFVSVRAGSQPFTSDFRGFIFSDTNAALRVFGTLNGNRDQFIAAIFRQAVANLWPKDKSGFFFRLAGPGGLDGRCVWRGCCIGGMGHGPRHGIGRRLGTCVAGSGGIHAGI